MDLASKKTSNKINENSILEKLFKFSENNTNLKTEIIAGITTFMTMAYILVVNPIILSDAGMDKGAVFVSTALASAFASILIGLYANYPFAIAPGMGLNAFFAYTVVKTMGYTWEFALTAVFIQGLLFILLTLFNVREKIIDSIPMVIKHAVTVGIGLFISFIGLVNVGLIQKGGAILTLGNMKDPLIILTLGGLILTAVLLIKNVKGAFLIGMVATSIVGMVLGLVKAPTGIFSMPPSISPVFMAFTHVSHAQIFSLDMAIIVFTFLFVDLFDTLGCLIGLATKANLLDKDGKLPRIKQALFADALGTTVGAVLGTSPMVTYIESASGVSEGGKTGFAAIVTGVLFLIAILFAPIFTAIPPQATAPVLILVGVMMVSAIVSINFDDFSDAIPAFLTIIMMPLSNSIAEGLVFGIVSYVLIRVLTGRRKSVNTTLYILCALFVLKYAIA